MLGHLDQRRFAQLRGLDQQILRLGEYFCKIYESNDNSAGYFDVDVV